MHAKEELFQILCEVQTKCDEISQKIDSIMRLLDILETYLTYSSLMQQAESSPDGSAGPHSHSTRKGNSAMNPQDLQKILSAVKKDDKPMTQTEFDAIFETMKQGKSPEEIARMEQMVQMAKSFMQ